MKKVKAFGIATSSKKMLIQYELGDEIRFFRSKKSAERFVEGVKFPIGEVVVPIEIIIKDK